MGNSQGDLVQELAEELAEKPWGGARLGFPGVDGGKPGKDRGDARGGTGG